MRRRTIILLAAWTVIMGSAVVPPAKAAESKESLKERIGARQERLNHYKKEGVIGETWQGRVEAVREESLKDEALKTLLEEENRDREKLYAILAEETKTTPAKVAAIAARKHKENLKSGEYWKATDGKWYRKK